MQMRIEKDSMGTMELPADALYGATTQRAVLNFPISGYRFSRPFVRALGLVKWAAAQANRDLGKLDEKRAQLITEAAEEVIEGHWDSQFPIDIFQTGSGTSTNMNANEVIANRCGQLDGKAIGSKDPVHPNDHVNMGQSSNDVIPTSIHIAVAESVRSELMPALDHLVRLGQEFSGYAKQVEYGKLRAGNAIAAVEELALGGTAVGTGLNSHPEFAGKVMGHLWNRTGVAFREARNHFEAQGAKDGLVEASGQMRSIAVSLFKIANDIRLLASGPRCGIGEIQLPATQPGSSIMPGKVNPVMCESVVQVCAQVFGNDTTVCWGGANGQLELNVMMPVMAHNVLESIRLLSNVARAFQDKCISGIIANQDRCNELVELSMAMVTSLAPLIGYDRAAEIAKESAATGKTVRQICRERQVLPEDQLNRALDPVEMTKPGGDGSAGG